MRVVVFGATGSVGRHLVAALAARGCDVVAASRSSGVDVVSGRGVDEALRGAAAAVDVTNVTAIRGRRAMAFFERTAAVLQSAAQRQGVDHLVVLSIVGVERMRAVGYYRAKLFQERHMLAGAVPATVVRATQFHELAAQLAKRGSIGPLAFVPDLVVQTVAARSVAEVLAEAAVGAPWRGRLGDVAGPGPAARLPGLARAALSAQGSPRRVVALPLPRSLARAVADGALLPSADARLVGPTIAEWLASMDPQAEGGGSSP